MTKNYKFFIILLVALLAGYSTAVASNRFSNSISPNEFGLQKAQSGEERYDVILRTHKEAIRRGMTVDYHGIKEVNLTIPLNAASIPLGAENEFAGVVFNVTNKSQNSFLFQFKNIPHSIDVTPKEIDKGRKFKSPVLNQGIKLLVVEDKNPWVKNRIGYSYGHVRRDIIYIRNGRGQNKPIMQYNNVYSAPSCKYYDCSVPGVRISGLTMNRTASSTSETFLCQIVGVNNVLIKDIIINTVPNDMVEDMAINILDCTNVNIDNVTINGTYSRTNYSGYGICMNNIWNFSAKKLTAKANWGIFGNNNINTARIEDSEINRFDVHCYGRDVSFDNVVFNDLYNQFSSVYGTIAFEKCTFNNFTPVLYEYSYNTYNEHNLIFNNCTFNPSIRRNYLVFAGILSDSRNERNELYQKCWPKISINNMRVNILQGINEIVLMKCKKEGYGQSIIDIIPPMSINGMKFYYENNGRPADLIISNESVETDDYSINIKGLKILPEYENGNSSNYGKTGVIKINIESTNHQGSVRVLNSSFANKSYFK